MGRIQMRETNYLQIVTSGLHRTAGPYRCARISMMASEQETLPQWAEYRCARPIISRSSHPACTARPVHTEVHGRRYRTRAPWSSTTVRQGTGPCKAAASVGGLVSPIYESTWREK